jgi:hypothetical protein
VNTHCCAQWMSWCVRSRLAQEKESDTLVFAVCECVSVCECVCVCVFDCVGV